MKLNLMMKCKTFGRYQHKVIYLAFSMTWYSAVDECITSFHDFYKKQQRKSPESVARDDKGNLYTCL